MGSRLNPAELEEAYFNSAVMTPERYRTTITLLRHFASHLELIAN